MKRGPERCLMLITENHQRYHCFGGVRCQEPVSLLFPVRVHSSKCVLHQIGACQWAIAATYFSYFFILPKKDSQCKRVERVYFNQTQKKKRLEWSAGECQQANVEVTKHQTFRRDLPYLGHQTPCELDFNLFLIEMHWNAWNSSGNPLQNHPKTFSPFVFEAEAFLTERHRTEAPFFSL